MKNTIKLATIGTSSISDRLIDAASQVEGIEYVGTLSRNAARAEAYSTEHGGSRWFGSLDEILGADDIDAVYIGSPNICHYDQAIQLIRAGKNVLIEKPICANHYEVQQLFAAANLHHIISTEAMKPLHDPAWAAIARALPKLGRLRRATLRFGRYTPSVEDVLAGKQVNVFDTEMAGGAVMDMGVYPIEVMCALFGAPEKVLAAPTLMSDASTEATHGAIDGAGSLLCTYGAHREHAGLVCEIAYSKISNDYLPSQIEGEFGSIVVDKISIPRHATLTLRVDGEEVSEEIAINPVPNNMIYEVQDFVTMINGGTINTLWGDNFNPRMAFTHFDNASLDTMGVIDEVRRQAGISFPADFRRG